ncbi:PREDICTED: tachykinin-like peptides receptor 99D isoform X2 [Nicrophorus vespilloides]|uniref:Tachykinin-like peptides receptor 99D isoform X2 n=1 Tax=Nicrophorus vespilloides TaxID=110193 RepID=A0ABM1M376_NICVS|nr:PREDICTED: tachykinin-like peptides receptor 99D isoform X2 [Nicrophorus vespilloides]
MKRTWTCVQSAATSGRAEGCRIVSDSVQFAKMNDSAALMQMDSSNSTLNYNYTNDSFFIPDSNQFILPVWRQVLWSTLFAGMVVVATGGNLIVIWIVLAHKRMRTVTNYFLLNLSVADTMVSTLNVTFNYVYMLNSHWPFGRLYCKISQFIAMLSICASVFSLMAISIDRYMAIMTPLRPRMGRSVTLCLAMSTWVLGIAISSPYLFVFTTFTEKYKNGEERVICYAQWPDGATNESLYEYIYNVFNLWVTYVVPIGSMTYTYARIGKELWGSQSIGECTQRQMDNIKSKRRVVKMMMVVVIIFAVCWLPFHSYFIVTSYFPDITNSPYIQESYLAIYWLAMSNSMYNPIIYCWMNARFRRGFKQFFSCLPYVNVSPGALTRREVFTSRRRSCVGSPDHNRIIRNDEMLVDQSRTSKRLKDTTDLRSFS